MRSHGAHRGCDLIDAPSLHVLQEFQRQMDPFGTRPTQPAVGGLALAQVCLHRAERFADGLGNLRRDEQPQRLSHPAPSASRAAGRVLDTTRR